MANDSFLYSGQTSASRREQKADERKLALERAKAELKPRADAITDHIDKEKQRIQEDVLEYIKADTHPDDIKSILLALKMYDSYLSTLKLKLSTILRHEEKTRKAQDD